MPGRYRRCFFGEGDPEGLLGLRAAGVPEVLLLSLPLPPDGVPVKIQMTFDRLSTVLRKLENWRAISEKND